MKRPYRRMAVGTQLVGNGLYDKKSGFTAEWLIARHCEIGKKREGEACADALRFSFSFFFGQNPMC